MTIKERLLKIHKLSQQIDELIDEQVDYFIYDSMSEKRFNEINIEIERLDDEIEILKLENKIENEMKLAKKGSWQHAF